MTRFGMREVDFGELAALMADVILRDAVVTAQVSDLRKRFGELRFCFGVEQLGGELDKLAAFLR
jgi:glycine/serine hydroxymethyltransferase